MAESKIKMHRKGGYAILPNTIAQDSDLRLDTKGLFWHMASRPADWEFTVSGLAASTNVCRDTIRKLLRNLEDCGYLLREQSHDSGGKFSANTYILYDEKTTVDDITVNGENRQRQKPSAVTSTQPSKDRTQYRNNKTPIVPTDVKQIAADYAGQDTELLDAIMGLVENRAAIKKPVKTVRCINGILSDLKRGSSGDRSVQLLMLKNATTANWLTVYPLKADERPASAPFKVQPRAGDYEV